MILVLLTKLNNIMTIPQNGRHLFIPSTKLQSFSIKKSFESFLLNSRLEKLRIEMYLRKMTGAEFSLIRGEDDWQSEVSAHSDDPGDSSKFS